MDIPRLWWERALEINFVSNSHANIFHDLKNDLLNLPELAEKDRFWIACGIGIY
jgi:hypothetical protein